MYNHVHVYVYVYTCTYKRNYKDTSKPDPKNDPDGHVIFLDPKTYSAPRRPLSYPWRVPKMDDLWKNPL